MVLMIACKASLYNTYHSYRMVKNSELIHKSPAGMQLSASWKPVLKWIAS